MILADKQNDSELMLLLPSIKNNLNEWQIVNVKITDSSRFTQPEIIQKLLAQFRGTEGIIHPLGNDKIIMIARLGTIDNYAVMKQEIESKLPEHSCRILLRKLNAAGLKQIQIEIMGIDKKQSTARKNLYKQRTERRTNVIMIADDDPFVLKTMKTLLANFGDVVEVNNSAQVVPKYIETNPDILLLDIHMPGKTGLQIIPEIIFIDSDAFLIILSADSQKENVLLALEEGAAGFLTKPPSKGKIQEYLNQCITIS